MEIVYRKLAELVPNPKNPRKPGPKGVKDLAESIAKLPGFFEARPILLSDRTGKLVIIAGERRSEAAASLGLTEVPTILLSGLTEEQEDEIMIRDNTHAGVWDDKKLAAWGKNLLKGWDVEGVKWSKPEIDVREDDYDFDNKKVESKVRRGEVWQLGEHRLMCGDSAESADFQKLMGGAVLIWCLQTRRMASA